MPSRCVATSERSVPVDQRVFASMRVFARVCVYFVLMRTACLLPFTRRPVRIVVERGNCCGERLHGPHDTSGFHNVATIRGN